MREILFRGKRVDNGEWVEGHVSFSGSYTCIHGPDEYAKIHQVYRKTVGQFTGLADKNGNKIFEGDIVRCWSGKKEDYLDYRELVDVVNFSFPYYRVGDNELAWNAENIEVIGNIHDNPELLKGGDKQ